MGSLKPRAGDLNTEMNRELHIMTAHLHRYGSELGWFEDIVADISTYHKRFFLGQLDDIKELESAGQRLSVGIAQVASQLKAVNCFRQELENKTRNILALVS